MFIYVTYKDAPELSTYRRKSSLPDESIEKQLLVNPDCYVRVMLEYIRKKCRLANSTYFDLCDESGALKGLFNLPTYEYATELFQHKKNYFLIVLRMDSPRGKIWTVLPQINQENPMYSELQIRVQKYIQDSGIINWETLRVFSEDQDNKKGKPLQGVISTTINK